MLGLALEILGLLVAPSFKDTGSLLILAGIATLFRWFVEVAKNGTASDRSRVP